MLLYLIFDKKAQFVFKSPHTYLALLLAVVIFSPVLIWNMQHQWGSFLFQLQNGYKEDDVYFFVKAWRYLFSTLRDYNVAFIAFVYYTVSQAKWIYRDRRFLFIFIPATLTLLFFFVSSFFGEPLNGWNAPYFFTASIFIAYFIVEKKWSKALKSIFFFLLIGSSLFLLVANAFTQFHPKNLAGRSEPLAVKYLISQLPKNLYQNRLVVSDYYWTTSLLNYFLPGQPDVYSVIPKGNQDYFWWNQYKQTHSLPKTVIYIASPSATPGATQKEVIIPLQEFKRCRLLKKVTYRQKRVFQKDYFWRFFVYKCELRSS